MVTADGTGSVLEKVTFQARTFPAPGRCGHWQRGVPSHSPGATPPLTARPVELLPGTQGRSEPSGRQASVDRRGGHEGLQPWHLHPSELTRGLGTFFEDSHGSTLRSDSPGASDAGPWHRSPCHEEAPMAGKSLKIPRRASESELPSDRGLPHLKGVGDTLAPVTGLSGFESSP